MINPESLQREKILFAYSSALEQGDFARVALILQQAESDPVLEQHILEINAALSAPQQETAPTPGDQPAGASLWRRATASVSKFFSIPPWRRPVLLRTTGVVIVGLLVVYVGVMALLGPAIGHIFSNVVLSAPPGNYPSPTQPPRLALTATPSANYSNNTIPGYPAPVGQQTTDRLVVRSASLVVVAADTRQARQAVLAMIAEDAAAGAFVVSSNESYPYGSQMPLISMALRVPVKNYDASMSRLAALGTQVLSRQENAQDVTQNYVDVTARIQALETSRDRLLEIVKEAKNTDDLLKAEQELSQRETELEAAKATQQYLSQTAALSSISLELRPAITSQPVTDKTWDPAAAFHTAAHTLLTSLTSFADSLIYFVIAVLPWLVGVGLVGFGVFRLVRLKNKNQGNRPR